jgi:antitoxin component of MazEF toxin-antitoxin module
MAYTVKLQKINRPTNRSFYVTIPVVLVEAMELQKGEEWQWTVDDLNTLVLQRVSPRGSPRRRRVDPTQCG